MKISVIIPVHNAQRSIAECLNALSQQAYPDYEVILVDNNSTDKSHSLMENFINKNKQFNARVFIEKKQGACAARNRGSREADGEIITHTDPDCLPDTNWLCDIAEAFEDKRISAVAGRIVGRKPENDVELFSALFTLSQGKKEEVHSKYTLIQGGYATANLSFRKTVFTSLNGFDETINYKGVGIGEDHDILARMYKNGGILKVVTNAVVFHWHRSNVNGIFKQGFLFGLAHAQLLEKYGKTSVMATFGNWIFHVPFPAKGWIDFNGIDKKIVIVLFLGLFNPLLILILPPYLYMQYQKIKQTLKGTGLTKCTKSALVCLLLLIIKCSGMTAGSIKGSRIFKVLCI